MNMFEFAQKQYDDVVAEQTGIRNDIEALMLKDEQLEVQRLKWLGRLPMQRTDDNDELATVIELRMPE